MKETQQVSLLCVCVCSLMPSPTDYCSGGTTNTYAPQNAPIVQQIHYHAPVLTGISGGNISFGAPNASVAPGAAAATGAGTEPPLLGAGVSTPTRPPRPTDDTERTVDSRKNTVEMHPELQTGRFQCLSASRSAA